MPEDGWALFFLPYGCILHIIRPDIRRSSKRQNYGDNKGQVAARVREEGRTRRGAQTIFRTAALLRMILWWWTHVISHSSKPGEWTTPRVSKCDQWSFGDYEVSVQVHSLQQTCRCCGGCWYWGGHACVGTDSMRGLLNFPANLKLL